MGWTKGVLAVAAGVMLTAVTSCSSSAPGAQAPVAASHPATTAPSSHATTSAAPTPSPTSPRAPTVSPPSLPLAPPRTPETVAGAERLTRAYLDALNEVEAKADLAGAKLLADYTLPTCHLCTQFNKDLLSDAVRARKLGGRSIGGQSTLVNLVLGIDPQFPTEALGSTRFSVTPATLVDSRGRVVDRGPGSPATTYLLHVSFLQGHWRVSDLSQAP